jgi:D-glycerate 3-kinase
LLYHGRMIDQCIATAKIWLGENTNLGPCQRNAMAELCGQLIETLPQPGTSPTTVCISGAPGSGKSTLARMLTAAMNQCGKRCLCVSLDDYYLPRNERLALARQLHPLCAVRGVAGTHDLALLLDHVRILRTGDISNLAIPHFDKAIDDRLAVSRPCDIEGPLDYIFIEGWLLGTTAVRQASLQTPVNRLEAEEDPRMIWRKWWNQQLQIYRQALTELVDINWYMRIPCWEAVIDWRWRQEQELPAPALKTRQDVQQFLAHFQSLVEHMQSSCDSWADLVIQLDKSHCATISGKP